MRRNDKQPKLKARRSKPDYRFGFRDNPVTAPYRHPLCDGRRTARHHTVVSLFSGCGGMDLSFNCIRANARGRIQFHHHLDRRLTVRECARLQTFPDQFVFPFTTQRNLTLIGNAVPPVLGYHVAKSVAANFLIDTGKTKWSC